MPNLTKVLALVHRPEFTGENRCLPCTVVSLVLAVTSTVLVIIMASELVGIAMFGASILLIYLRGYLVPGTPWITATYFPKRVLQLFGKAEHRSIPEETDSISRHLLQAGVLEGDRSKGTLRLASDFQESWLQRISELSPNVTDVADMFGASETVSKSNTSFVVDENQLVHWESEVALVVDIAGAAELYVRLEEWSALDGRERLNILATMRVFLPYCPSCGGQLKTTREKIKPCCHPEYVTIRSSCERCEVLLLEIAVDENNPEWIDALLIEES